MPKAEKGSLKDLGKQIKSKGLQKLKFYCQMCEKQCRDANGFKCHLTSESHLRQMKVFSENAGAYMDRYSKAFEKLYMDTLRMRHGTSRTAANQVYQQVIQDKVHIHMNATIWLTLTDFCKYLGKTGKCVVEETERGWYVTYIEQNVARLQQQEATHRRLELEKEAEHAMSERMEQQRIEAAKALDRAGGVLSTQATKLERPVDGDDVATVHLSFKAAISSSDIGGALAKGKLANKMPGKSVFGDDDESDEEHDEGVGTAHKLGPLSLPAKPQSKGQSIEEVRKRSHTGNDNRASQSADRGDKKAKRETDAKAVNDSDKQPWLYRDILVRIISKELADGKYYRHKAVVDKVLDDGFSAQVSVVDNGPLEGHVLRLDQDDLETVAPKHVHEKVRIVRGQLYGTKAMAIELDKKAYRAILKLRDGTVLDRVDYDDFSKVA